MDIEVQGSLVQVADKLVNSVREIMRTARTEEDLRIGFEKVLDPVLKRALVLNLSQDMSV